MARTKFDWFGTLIRYPHYKQNVSQSPTNKNILALLEGLELCQQLPTCQEVKSKLPGDFRNYIPPSRSSTYSLRRFQCKAIAVQALNQRSFEHNEAIFFPARLKSTTKGFSDTSGEFETRSLNFFRMNCRTP